MCFCVRIQLKAALVIFISFILTFCGEWDLADDTTIGFQSFEKHQNEIPHMKFDTERLAVSAMAEEVQPSYQAIDREADFFK